MNYKILAIAIIVLSFITAIYFYPISPERIPSHWNIDGQVDGYMNRFWGLFLMPIVSLVMFLLLTFVPKIDPLKANIDKFKKYYNLFIFLIILFLFYIYAITILWSQGYQFEINRLMPPAVGILIFYCGVLIENSKRNWFIGIRTPWTLSNDIVWDKTNKLGGKLFKICGVISFLSLFLPDYSFLIVILPIFFTALYSVIYSYFEFKKNANGVF